jgi:lipopolysaccharide transport system permease protein
VGTLLAALNVSYRDFRYVIPFMVQLWMFATPTVYMKVHEPREHNAAGAEAVEAAATDSPAADSPAEVDEPATDRLQADDRASDGKDASRSANVPEPVKQLLRLNPLTGIIGFFRAAVLGDPLPWHSIEYSIAGAVLIFFVGCLYFRRVEGTFADII